jgi:hypothetical protein
VIIEKVRSYRQAGVQHLVIDPDSNDLGNFVRQLGRFAAEVMPGVT